MADRDEYLTINSVELALDGAWVVVDPTPMIGEGPSRGTDLIIPGSGGVLDRDKVRGSLRVQLGMFVYGEKDQAGSTYADVRAGLRDNVEYLRAQLLAHTVGTVTCTYTFPDASTVSGDVQVLTLEVGAYNLAQGIARAAIDVHLVDGRLT